jgi:hypothetical protein
LLDGRNALALQRDQVALTVQGQQRQQQEDRVVESAKAKLEKLTGLESDYTEQVLAITTDRDQQLQALQATWAERDETERQKKIDEQIKLNDADTQEKLSYLDLQLADKLVNQQTQEELAFQIKQAAKDRELALLKQKNGEESAEYKKLNAEKIKEQATHNSKVKKSEDELVTFKKGLSQVESLLNDETANALEASLGKQSGLYKAFQLARKAAAIAKIEVDLVQEIQGYWAGSSEFGPAGTIWAAVQSGIAVVRAGVAMNTVAGYEKGGPTGDGVMIRRPTAGKMMDSLSMATGMSIGGDGKLMDAKGLEVAGIVHKNEYVIPEWMRQDPEVLQVENWLENRRQRGFYDGGTTTEGDNRAAESRPGPAAPAMNDQLVRVLTSLDQRLQGVEDWATQLEVHNDILGLDREMQKLKKVRNSSAIKPS